MKAIFVSNSRWLVGLFFFLGLLLGMRRWEFFQAAQASQAVGHKKFYRGVARVGAQLKLF